ncbi:PTS system mannose/fructose/sorbose family transporter subunit IID [Sporanaerobacter acetigenes]|uniref:PTS system, mannose-specific IID component n=1 Tax=Sporanaerobacter acetigenes DSM 13106 TaxID=1123281 RepID=A0A1M5VL73_9FIRM|nr:PTS system mannose/fructose/sorbose family transporter subunit IID [Sporanaerobacter acetigenes]SHH76016.1 PTS system, mannose-specific IID component [Sporanaerobacter acetigenes DSM 13106]
MPANNEVKEVERKKKLTKKDIRKSWFRWLTFAQSSFNYERMQASGFAHSMCPIIDKLYDTKEEKAQALKRHLTFFNTNPTIGTLTHGITIAMEEEKANGAEISDDAINSIKTGLMGPLAGIGDTLTQGVITPILLAFGVGLGKEGNLMGPILYMVLISVVIIWLSYSLWMKGYKLGRSAVEQILGGGVFNDVIQAAGILGCTVIGALTGKFVNITTPIEIKIGETAVGLQADLFDMVMPGLLPLLLTLWTYKQLEKGKSPVKVMLYIMAIGAVGSILKIF